MPAWLVSNEYSKGVSGSSQKYPMGGSKDLSLLKLFGFSSVPDLCGNYGYGGQGEQNKHGGRTQGGPGFAKVAYTSSYSGRGGKAGEMKPSQIISSTTSGLWALPGAGGAAGTATANPGMGLPTYVDRFPLANGGAAAVPVNKNDSGTYCNKSNAGGKTVGCEGERSQTYHTMYNIKNYGGFALNSGVENSRDGQFINIFPVNNRYPHASGMGGAGGGGGGAAEVSSNNVYWGLGSKGASGAVIIEWY